MTMNLELILTRFLMAAAAIAALASFACTYESDVGLHTFTKDTEVLVGLRRADGSQIPDLVSEIETQYGFRAQMMNIVVPKITIDLTSRITESDPANFRATTIVSGWDTIEQEVVNDVVAVPVQFRVNGEDFTSCTEGGNCGNFRTHIADYADFFASHVQNKLQEEMELAILDSDGANVLRLEPSLVDFYCVIDESEITTDGTYDYYEWEIVNAVICSGEVEFRLD